MEKKEKLWKRRQHRIKGNAWERMKGEKSGKRKYNKKRTGKEEEKKWKRWDRCEKIKRERQKRKDRNRKRRDSREEKQREGTEKSRKKNPALCTDMRQETKRKGKCIEKRRKLVHFNSR